MASIVHKVFLTWFCLLLFLIFLNLRLDETVDWNWFLVMFPLWMFDLVLIAQAIFNIIRRRNQGSPTQSTILRRLQFMVYVFLLLIFKVLVCVRLQYVDGLPVTAVCSPMWLLLLALAAELSVSLIRRSYNHPQSILRNSMTTH